MTGDGPRTGPRHEPGRIHERAADPAEAANRPLEPRAPGDELFDNDETGRPPSGEAHARLNTPVGELDPAADSDPYRISSEQDDSDRASGTTGSGQGAER